MGGDSASQVVGEPPLVSQGADGRFRVGWTLTLDDLVCVQMTGSVFESFAEHNLMTLRVKPQARMSGKASTRRHVFVCRVTATHISTTSRYSFQQRHICVKAGWLPFDFCASARWGLWRG